MHLISIVPILLLFMSIKGVEFKISMFGISLSKFENLKEIIIIAVLVSTTMLSRFQNAREELISLRKMVFIKKFDDEHYENLKLALPHTEVSESRESFIFSKKYSSTGIRTFIEILYVILSLTIVSILFSIIFYVFYVILFDIWYKPNFSPFVSRLIVVLFCLFVSFDILINAVKKYAKYTYIDRIKWDKVKLTNDSDGELEPELKELTEKIIQREFHVKKAFRYFFEIALISLSLTAMFVYLLKYFELL